MNAPNCSSYIRYKSKQKNENNNGRVKGNDEYDFFSFCTGIYWSDVKGNDEYDFYHFVLVLIGLISCV